MAEPRIDIADFIVGVHRAFGIPVRRGRYEFELPRYVDGGETDDETDYKVLRNMPVSASYKNRYPSLLKTDAAKWINNYNKLDSVIYTNLLDRTESYLANNPESLNDKNIKISLGILGTTKPSKLPPENIKDKNRFENILQKIPDKAYSNLLKALPSILLKPSIADITKIALSSGLGLGDIQFLIKYATNEDGLFGDYKNIEIASKEYYRKNEAKNKYAFGGELPKYREGGETDDPKKETEDEFWKRINEREARKMEYLRGQEMEYDIDGNPTGHKRRPVGTRNQAEIREDSVQNLESRQTEKPTHDERGIPYLTPETLDKINAQRKREMDKLDKQKEIQKIYEEFNREHERKGLIGTISKIIDPTGVLSYEDVQEEIVAAKDIIIQAFEKEGRDMSYGERYKSGLDVQKQLIATLIEIGGAVPLIGKIGKILNYPGIAKDIYDAYQYEKGYQEKRDRMYAEIEAIRHIDGENLTAEYKYGGRHELPEYSLGDVHIAFNKVRPEADRCSGNLQLLLAEMLGTELGAVRQYMNGDSWKLGTNAVSAGGTRIYDGISKDEMAKYYDVKTNKNTMPTNKIVDMLRAGTKDLDIGGFEDGDIVQLFNTRSRYKDEALKSGNDLATHVGVVSIDEDGERYIVHSTGTTWKKEKLSKYLDDNNNSGMYISSVVRSPGLRKMIGIDAKKNMADNGGQRQEYVDRFEEFFSDVALLDVGTNGTDGTIETDETGDALAIVDVEKAKRDGDVALLNQMMLEQERKKKNAVTGFLDELDKLLIT